MKRAFLTGLLALAALGVAVPAHAGKGGPLTVPTIVTKKDRKDNKAFIGVNWNWGAREGATLVLGYRFAKTKADDKVRGGLVDVTFALTGAPLGTPGEIHIKALGGKRSVQGEAGVGYGFQAGAFLVNAGVRAPFVTAGTDYLFGKGWQPYVGVHSLGKMRNAESTTSCPAGYDLEDGICVGD